MKNSSGQSTRTRLLLGVVLPAFLCVPANADAQQTPASSGDALEVVVVTAQKRSENLQNVPVAVTALSAEALTNRGASGVLDLSANVPSLYFTTNGGEGQPHIRAIGAINTAGGNESSVSTYVDDVYYAAAAASVLSFNNIEQVSVLKGPQGTLFGRNATGGLIQITTRDPTQEVSGNLAVTYGSQNTFVTDGYLSGGVAPGLAADIAVHFNYMGDGFGTNAFDGTDAHRTREIALRSKWVFAPDDNTKLTFIADYSKSRDTEPAFRPIYGQTQLGGYRYTGDPFDVDTNIDDPTTLEQYGFSLNAQRAFGGVKLVSITAYRNNNYYAVFDSDGTPANTLSIFVPEPGHQFSEELRVQSNDSGRLSWVLGLYYFNYVAGFDDVVVNGTALCISPFLPCEEVLTTRQTTNSYSAFGQATYRIDDLTNATVGLRYTAERKSVRSPGGVFDSFPIAPYHASDSVDKPTWRLAIDHHFNENVMAYVSYNRGFKNGGFDPAGSTASPFDPESLDAYEVGVKTEFLDHKLRLNAAAYYYDFSGIQLNQYQGGLIDIYNGSSATVKGFDLDVTAILSPGLTLTGGLSYSDGRYGDFPISATAEAPGGGLVQLPDESADGKHMQLAPDWQANLGIDYSFQVGSDTVALNANYAYMGRWYSAPDNRLSQDPYSLVNASASWYFGAAGNYHVSLWGKNLGDTVYAQQLTVEFPLGDLISTAPGRTFGLTAAVNF